MKHTLGFERRWPDEFHIVSAKHLGIEGGQTGYRGGAEELLHLSCRRECNQHSPRLLADGRKSMRDIARAENRISGAQFLAAVADLEEHFALDNVEPFLLVEMQVQRRAAFHQVDVLDEEQTAARIARNNLEEDGAEAERVRLTETVLAGGHEMSLGRGLGGRGIFDCEGGESGRGNECSCGLQKGAALHAVSD